MNCPQCQERLDERLDEMRPALRSGALTPTAARAQAQTEFDSIVSDCPECEGELRSHLQLRLALMTPDAEMASVEVPSAIRLNVRRALEREPLPLPPPRPTWKPLKGFAWTGGAIMSAIVLFAVARPFLIESAQKPYSAPSTNTESMAPAPVVQQSAPKTRVTPPAATVKRAPVPGAIKQAQRPGMAPLKPVPQPRVGKATPPSNPTAETESPSFLEMAPPKITVLPPASTSRESKPKVPAKENAPGEVRPRLSPPATRPPQRPSASQPQPPAPMVGSAAPSGNDSSITQARVPDERRLDSKLLAPSGKELGFVVRFVSPAPAGAVRPNVRSAAPLMAPIPSFRSMPKERLEDSVTPEALAPPTPPIAPADNSNVGDTVQKSSGGAGKSAGSPGPAVPAPAPVPALPTTKGSLLISVKKEVVNARVIGEIKDKGPKDTVLWTGKASAGQSIPVPLEPLGAVKGDTVIVSFQQQVSSSETKTLATESVIVP